MLVSDDLLEAHKDQPDAKRWHICGIGLMPWDQKMYDALTSQVRLHALHSFDLHTAACHEASSIMWASSIDLVNPQLFLLLA